MKVAVVLFVFNRPEHTKRVLEGLKKNRVEKLYIFADGARSTDDEEEVMEVRNLIKNIDWCNTEIEYKEQNVGLAESIIKGVTGIFQRGYDGVIVLEDDCVPRSNFLKFMNDALVYYKDNKEVMHISGFGLPIKKYTDSDIYFTPYPCSWGWGTWAECWNACNFYSVDAYRELLSSKEKSQAFNYAGEAFSEFLDFQVEGKVNSWLIRWYFHIFNTNGKCVWCYDSLIENKGFDGSGIHKNKIDRFNQKHNLKKDKDTFNFDNNVAYHPQLIREFRRHFMGKSYIEKIKTVIYLATGIIIGK
ncbi:glycosyltransferase family 2 protein [Ectobacillus antri]|uniref:glycosyltransferase family 2 protein n=1 Tax=Ectobacillus antri TaxID=2486280 RepID=UPI000F5A509C|nr:sugar transferase [Ectobacillus antri]